jgi:hypothetical protein
MRETLTSTPEMNKTDEEIQWNRTKGRRKNKTEEEKKIETEQNKRRRKKNS